MTRKEMRSRREAARRRRIIRVALAALAVAGTAVIIAACTSSLDSAESKAELPAPVPEIQESVAPSAVPSPIPTPGTTQEPEETTVEEMLENGTLTDSISLSYDLQLVARDAAETFGDVV